MKHIVGRRASPSRARYFWLAACPVVAGAIAIRLTIFSQTGGAGTVVNLGSASTYAALAGSEVTSTGLTVLNGDLGLSPATASSVTGFPPGIVNGNRNTGPSGLAARAQLALTTAYNAAKAEPSTATVSAIGSASLDPVSLIPGVYTASSSLDVNGQLTL